MNTARQKANAGMALLILFLVTLVTGIVLHLKKHGILIEPRSLIKIIHWVAGFLMVAFVILHGCQFRKMFIRMKPRMSWFRIDTWGVIIFTTLTFVTGLVKILSPVKIPNLGLWHYWLGMIMSVMILIHLIRGIPSLNRLIKIK